MATTELKENIYHTRLEPIEECVGYEEIPQIPVYILDKRTPETWWNDAFGRPLCVILEVAEAEKHGLSTEHNCQYQIGDLGIYEVPTLMACGLMEKIESGELLAHYTYNDANGEYAGYSGEVPLVILTNKDGEKVFVSVDDDIERMFDMHEESGGHWTECSLDY